MQRILRCPSLVYLALALISVGCSKKLVNHDDPQKPEILRLEKTNTEVTKEWIRDVGYRPVIAGQIERESTIDKSLSCIQWVKLSDGKNTAEALEFHRAACPNDGVALGDQSLAFRTWMTKSEETSGVSTYTLFKFQGEGDAATAVNVGQAQFSDSTTDARLEDLCQFTNQTTSVPYGDACKVTELEKSWGAVELKTKAVAETPAPPAEEPDSTEQELSRR